MHDDAEVAKAVVQGTVEGVLAPFTTLLERLFGQAADEAGLVLGDTVRGVGIGLRLRMQERTARLLRRTQMMLAEMNVQPKQVPLKLLVPLIEQGTLEEDDNLQDRWAALLANAATSRNSIPPAFPELLKQLSSLDARLLHQALLHISQSFGLSDALSQDLDRFIGKMDQQLDSYIYPMGSRQSVNNLIRLGLLRALLVQGEQNSHLRFTKLGCDFTRACEDPKTALTLRDTLPALDCN